MRPYLISLVIHALVFWPAFIALTYKIEYVANFAAKTVLMIFFSPVFLSFSITKFSETFGSLHFRNAVTHALFMFSYMLIFLIFIAGPIRSVQLWNRKKFFLGFFYFHLVLVILGIYTLAHFSNPYVTWQWK